MAFPGVKAAWVARLRLVTAVTLVATAAACAAPPLVRLRSHTPLYGAAAPEGLRVMSFNIARGAGLTSVALSVPEENFAKNLSVIAQLIQREAPDIVALQEVDTTSPWTSNFDNLIFLGRQSNYSHAFLSLHTRIDLFGFWRDPVIWGGSALLSRLPLGDPRPLAFRVDALDAMGLAIATVQPEGFPTQVDVISVHLNPESADKRARQAEMMEELYGPAKRTRPLIVMGDLNNGDVEAVRDLCRRLQLSSFRDDANLPTYPSDAPAARLDWILISDELRFVAYHTLPERLSDHMPVLATIAPRATPFAMALRPRP